MKNAIVIFDIIFFPRVARKWFIIQREERKPKGVFSPKHPCSTVAQNPKRDFRHIPYIFVLLMYTFECLSSDFTHVLDAHSLEHCSTRDQTS